MAPGGEAQIDYSKCINCGACVYHCPFGATVDVSSIVDVIEEIKKAEQNKDSGKVIAIVAPSIASQFTYASLGQVISGIKALGFDEVLEVAVGAEMVFFQCFHKIENSTGGDTGLFGCDGVKHISHLSVKNQGF